jgi:hypothetical protein
MAQSEYDALKYSQSDIIGTARYMSMGGAFGALGGDGSAIHLNPAGLGVYRSSEISLTTGLLVNNVNSSWNGFSSDDTRYKVPFNNFTFVLNFDRSAYKKSGLVSSSFAITYNKLKDFNRYGYFVGKNINSSIADYLANFTNGINEADLEFDNPHGYRDPFDNPYIPWLSILAYQTYLIDPLADNEWSPTASSLSGLVNPTYSITENGLIGEWGFSYGANISNLVYLGATLGIKDISYSRSTQYTEDFADGGGMTLNNYFETEGTGVNLKIGAIVHPIDFLRVGASVQTPTFYSMTDTYDADMSSYVFDIYDEQYYPASCQTYYGQSYYDLQDPFRYNLSAAFIFGKKGLVSMDFGQNFYTIMKLRDDSGRSNGFSYENNQIDNALKNTSTFRIGAEYKVTEELALRAGYALETTSCKNDGVLWLPDNTTRTDPEFFLNDYTANYYSAGIGYREKFWFLDFAYQLKQYKQDFYAYNYIMADTPAYIPAKIENFVNSFILTLGFKF